ncbi:hypothetical protein INT43_006682, partial [Umbelopsis isabellina]
MCAPRAAKDFPRMAINERTVETAGGHLTSIKNQAMLTVSIAGNRQHIAAYIFDMKFDVILGMNWFETYRSSPIWGSKVEDCINLISPRKLERLERQEEVEELFVVYHQEKPTKTHQGKTQSFLQDDADVFRSELPGLPPM